MSRLDVSTDCSDCEARIRAEVINELKSQKDEIVKWLIKRNNEGYGITNGELLDHFYDLAEKLKEKKK